MVRILFVAGTFCNFDNMLALRDYLYENSKQQIDGTSVHCWSKNRTREIDIEAFDYRPQNWNVIDNYDIAIGHSAGGFPLWINDAKMKITINPPYPDYLPKPLVSGIRGRTIDILGYFWDKIEQIMKNKESNLYILRANKDWLIPSTIQKAWRREVKERAGISNTNIKIYTGGHSTMPFKDVLRIVDNFKQ